MDTEKLKELLTASAAFEAWKPGTTAGLDLNFSGDAFIDRGETWHSGPEPKPAVDHKALALEPHYEPTAVAKLWGLSVDTVRTLFENEPGVIKYGHEGTRLKRQYWSIRIPESVMVRVHRKYSAA